MEPDAQALSQEAPSKADGLAEIPPPPAPGSGANGSGAVRRIFIGPQGLRAGWSVLLFILFAGLFMVASGLIVGKLLGLNQGGKPTTLSPFTSLLFEAVQVGSILAAGALMTRIERRRLKDYNLADRRGLAHFFSGAAVGFIALSVLVGALAWGGWLHFGPLELSAGKIAGFGAIWAAAFVLTGFFEEGSFRCYLQFTLTRGINFWWALGIIGAACVDLGLRHTGGAGWGVYIIALLGLFPCLWLHVRRAAGSGFWQAAWTTSTLFGFLHVTNSGETWIGIFSAAAIGFVFCVSIWVTGSAWWAIGCHAAWDWAETFFYGTADSGLIPKGHFLTTAPAGNAFWSGGSTGPEGSILILGILVLFLITLLVLYGRKRAVALPQPPVQEPVQEPTA